MIFETESNNNSSSANSLPVGETVIANFNYSSDSDYYAVWLSTPGIATFKVSLYDPNASSNPTSGVPKQYWYTPFKFQLFDAGLGLQLETKGPKTVQFGIGSPGKYYLAVSQGSGFGYSYSIQASFVSSDTTPPLIVGFSPSNNQTNVNVGSDITFTFGESIQRGSGFITIKTDAGAIVEKFDVASSNAITISDRILKINPSSNLAYGTSFVIDFDSGSINDMALNKFPQYSGYQFSTASPPDTRAPNFVNSDPLDGASEVSVDANLIFVFDEPVQFGSKSIVLKKSSGEVVQSFSNNSFQVSLNGNRIEINPSSNLGYETTYVVEFQAGSIKDLSNNNIVGITSFDFKTKSDPASVQRIWTQNAEGYANTDGNDVFDGLGGVDYVSYKLLKSEYLISLSSDKFIVIANSGSEGADVLYNIERLQFSDMKVAIDIDGNAGIVAKILASVFGASAVTNKQYAGIGLNLIDGGMSYEALSALAINAAGAKTREAVVDLLWTNLMGKAPTAAEAKPYIDMLATDLSNVGTLGKLAADYAATIGVVNLTTLSQTGLEYV